MSTINHNGFVNQTTVKAIILHFAPMNGEVVLISKYMLLHPCRYNIQFTSTKPNGCRPKGGVLVNRILHKQGCIDKFISHGKHTLGNYACALYQRQGIALFCVVV